MNGDGRSILRVFDIRSGASVIDLVTSSTVCANMKLLMANAVTVLHEKVSRSFAWDAI